MGIPFPLPMALANPAAPVQTVSLEIILRSTNSVHSGLCMRNTAIPIAAAES